MTEYIYTITCKSNGKVYVGRTCNHKRRKTQHLCKLSQQKHANKSLQASFNKYGVDALEFAVIESADSEVIKERELYYFNKMISDGVTLFNHRITDASGGVDFKSDKTREIIFDILDIRYYQKIGLKDLGKRFGVSTATLMIYIPEWEVLRGKKMTYHVQVEKTLDRVAKFVEAFNQIGREAYRRLDEFKLSHQALVKHLPKFGMSFDDVRLDEQFRTAPIRAAKAIDLVANGYDIKAACKEVGVSIATFYKYRNQQAFA
jgi:predicted GIY-YIG superfamily endonuclease